MVRTGGVVDDAVVRLGGGRRIGYAVYGDPSGAPVVHFHGTPSSRVEVAFAAGRCAALGLRLVSIDRPGMGRSDRRAGRRLLEWPADVAAVADHLGLDRFAVHGWSGGGPHALACGVTLAERVSRVVITAGCGPIDLDGIDAATAPSDRFLTALCQRRPLAAGALLRSAALTARLAPRAAVRSLAAGLSRPDRAVLRRADPGEVVASFVEAVRPGPAGSVEDYALLGEPWGFALADVAVPVTLWHGEDDRVVPAEQSRILAEELPDATLRLQPGHGHFLLRELLEDVLGPLAG
jgi:pimeloyl-ACP methyl ester carboxylesterase